LWVIFADPANQINTDLSGSGSTTLPFYDLFIQATSDEITIMWAPPTSNSILVRGYTIGWGKGIPDEYTKVVDNKQRYFLIENLSKSVNLQRCV
jgi:hypothetical protein